MTLITQIEAKRRNLSGYDSFKRTQLAYRDNLNRDHFVVSLNREALKIFNLSVTLGQHIKLKIEAENIQKQLADGTFKQENYQISEVKLKLLEDMNLEFFYIATGFELHFKSWLLQNDYIVNIIDKVAPFKQLRKDQEDRPISKPEFFTVGSFMYDTTKQINILQGLTEHTLFFSTILNKTNYVRALGISSDVIGIAEDYRNLRNQIHLPGDTCETPNIHRLAGSATDLMIDFINEKIVDNSNHLIQQNKFSFSPFSKL